MVKWTVTVSVEIGSSRAVKISMVIVRIVPTNPGTMFSEVSPRPHDTGLVTLLSQDLSEFALHARAILGLPVMDATGGFRCYRRRVLEAIDLDAIHSNGYSFQIELVYRTLRAGFQIGEVPIVFPDRRVGQSKMSRRIVLEALLTVWRLRFSRT